MTDSPHGTPQVVEIPHTRAGWRTRIRRNLLTGLVILVPAALTAFILVKIFTWGDSIFGRYIHKALDPYLPGIRLPGLGFVVTVLAVFLLGWLSTSVVGRRLIQATEQLICRIPVAKSVYSATKGILEALSLDQREAFKRVVLIEYPKQNLYAIAFVTGGAQWPSVHQNTADLLLVFVPTTPNPTSGFLLLVPRHEAIDLPISVEEGVRMVISGGILLPRLPPALPHQMPVRQP